MGSHLLKRHVKHDHRSRDYPAKVAKSATGPVVWPHHGGVMNQGNVGACTAFALEQWRKTDPYWRSGVVVSNREALALYHLETVMQGGPVYPPSDPGGSGLWVCKAAIRMKFIRSYSWVFGIEHAIGAIYRSPFLVGTNWYENMFYPDSQGTVTISGEIAGGHEYLCLGYDPANGGRWMFLNSWGSGWGKGGVFYMSTGTFDRLLKERGDIVVPHR